ncbi:hypothetical protein EVAR_96679_1 [Eumeta japonica]|uniref:Uncharacterized protein n=1 Tax=Eumeta variegata TaxID=151549 RepID=A0A4C1WH99_EUMVA|nr:hypothetical protein EVAR_96679_1 [Eumeta japonica]
MTARGDSARGTRARRTAVCGRLMRDARLSAVVEGLRLVGIGDIKRPVIYSIAERVASAARGGRARGWRGGRRRGRRLSCKSASIDPAAWVRVVTLAIIIESTTEPIEIRREARSRRRRCGSGGRGAAQRDASLFIYFECAKQDSSRIAHQLAGLPGGEWGALGRHYPAPLLPAHPHFAHHALPAPHAPPPAHLHQPTHDTEKQTSVLAIKSRRSPSPMDNRNHRVVIRALPVF